MPHDHDLIFDFHEHDDHVHRTTGYAHIHDRHPYHYHDRNGSVDYHTPNVALLADLIHAVHDDPAPDPIGCGGSDIDRRAGTPT